MAADKPEGVSERRHSQKKKLNRQIIWLGVGLTALTAVYHLGKEKVVPVATLGMGRVWTITVIIGVYLAAAIFTRLTASQAIRAIKGATEPEVQILVAKSYTLLVYGAATIVSLWMLGITLQNLTIAITLITTGLAFAVRDIIMSYLVWLILLIKRPFRIGDNIKIDDHEGRVQHIGTFYVLLDDTPDRREDFTRIPNKTFLEKPIHNFGPEKILLRLALPLETLPENPDKLIDRIEKRIKKRVGEPVRPWIDTDGQKFQLKFEILTKLEKKKGLRESIIFETICALKEAETARKKKTK